MHAIQFPYSFTSPHSREEEKKKRNASQGSFACVVSFLALWFIPNPDQESVLFSCFPKSLEDRRKPNIIFSRQVTIRPFLLKCLQESGLRGELWHTSAIRSQEDETEELEFKASLESPVRPRLKNKTTMNCSCLQSTAYLSWIYIQKKQKAWHDICYYNIKLLPRKGYKYTIQEMQDPN